MSSSVVRDKGPGAQKGAKSAGVGFRGVEGPRVYDEIEVNNYKEIAVKS